MLFWLVSLSGVAQWGECSTSGAQILLHCDGDSFCGSGEVFATWFRLATLAPLEQRCLCLLRLGDCLLCMHFHGVIFRLLTVNEVSWRVCVDNGYYLLVSLKGSILNGIR